MRVERCTYRTIEEWVRLRKALWPDEDEESLREEAREMVEKTDDFGVFLACDGPLVAGFAEVCLRRDYVNGCCTSPVGFLEGIYVRPGHRRRGVARMLCAAAEAWVRERGCFEFASDADLANAVSHHMHRGLGFEETERVVYFRKTLR